MVSRECKECVSQRRKKYVYNRRGAKARRKMNVLAKAQKDAKKWGQSIARLLVSQLS
jgi:hypothetical protein